MSWTDPDDGWPVPYPSRLREAIRDIPGAEWLSDADVDAFARLIAAVAEGGQEEELPRSRPASQEATDKQLTRLHDLAEALAGHIATLNQPAVEALADERARAARDVFEVQRVVRRLQEAAKNACGADVPSAAPARRKVEAAEVTAITAGIFEEVSGLPATFTTDETGAVSGDWPRVLGLIFEALYIDASVAAQIKVLARKSECSGNFDLQKRGRSSLRRATDRLPSSHTR